MEKQKAINILSRIIEGISIIRDLNSDSEDFTEWLKNTKDAIKAIFGENSSQLSEFESIDFMPALITSNTYDSDWKRWYKRGLDSTETILSSMKDEIEKYWPDEN